MENLELVSSSYKLETKTCKLYGCHSVHLYFPCTFLRVENVMFCQMAWTHSIFAVVIVALSF